jgi:nucleotide-binding universal stress UspA family protein
MKPTHVLIPVDFCESSLGAIRYGLSMAEAFSADLTLIHVLVQPAEPADAEAAEARLRSHVDESFRGRARILTPLVTRTIEEEILGTVEETGVDLVVMGTHGRRPFMRFLIGSTTEHLLRVMPVPLITVTKSAEAQEQASGERPGIRRILYPTDFSEPTESALPIAAEFARTFGAELEMIHVVEPLVLPLATYAGSEQAMAADQETLTRHAEESLKKLASSPAVRGITTRWSVLEGRPWQTILAHAARTRVGLIAMSLHGRGFLERALLGTTAERVIRDSPIPVMGIPAQSEPGS